MASSTFGSSGPNSSTTAALWGHLLHKKPHTALAANLKSSSEDLVPPMRPVDKAATSVRMLLHDTQAVLEKFSGRVDKLHGEIEDAKREVATSHKVFQHGHEKLLLEQVDLVNRCQTQLQKSLGKPAQTSSMDEVLRDVQSTNRRLEGLDRRVDALHMLNQTQLQALQVMQEQQGKLLTLLSPIIPLIEAIPLHIDSAKNDIKQSVREVNALTTTLQDSLMLFKNEMSASVSTCFRPTPVRLVPLSPVSSPRRSTPRKRRRTTDNPEDLSSSELATEPLPGLGPTLDEINTKSVRPALAPNAIASSSQLCYPTTTESYGTSQTLVYDENYSSNLDRSLSDPSDSESAHPIVSSLTASGPREPEGLAHPIHQPLHFHTIPEEPVGVYSSSPPAVIAVIAQDSRPSTGSSSPHMSNAFNARPTDSTSKTPVPMTIPAPKLHCSEVDETVVPSSHAVEPASTLHSVQLPVHLSNVRPTISRPLSDIAIGSSGASKPMSLKDRRARDPLIESTMNKPGKRFIPFDDLDDDELEGDVL